MKTLPAAALAALLSFPALADAPPARADPAPSAAPESPRPSGSAPRKKGQETAPAPGRKADAAPAPKGAPKQEKAKPCEEIRPCAIE